jgi:uncharacterized OsmC-like protein
MNNLVSIQLTQQKNYQFKVNFEGVVDSLITDEPPPLGLGSGPSPVQLLCSSVGNCLCASLLFALRKFKIEPGLISASVQAEVGRNDQSRVRVLGLDVTINLKNVDPQHNHLANVLKQFEEFCTVTQSVRSSIPVRVKVLNNSLEVLHASS